jgi:hypothetical protein
MEYVKVQWEVYDIILFDICIIPMRNGKVNNTDHKIVEGWKILNHGQNSSLAKDIGKQRTHLALLLKG